MTMLPQWVGTPVRRVEAVAKVRGTAPYAYEHPTFEPAFAVVLQAEIARGRVVSVDTKPALALEGC